ncbi:MAG: hypothetical protein OXQ84_06935 [bacterium]|nr:hypothetical protein [bacterium]
MDRRATRRRRILREGKVRIERLKEPLELYTEFFDTFVSIFDRLIDQIEKLTEPDPTSRCLRVWAMRAMPHGLTPVRRGCTVMGQ